MAAPSETRPDIASWIARLRTRGQRDRSGLFVVEGVGAFLHACDAAEVVGVAHSDVLLRASTAQRAVRRARQAGVPVERMSPEAFRALSCTQRASGVAAVVRQRWVPIEAVDPARGTCVLALERLRSPGNLGTILRTAEAAGVRTVVLLDPATDPHDPAVVRASMGALLRLELVRALPGELASWARAAGARCIGTSPRAALDHTRLPLDRPPVVLVGEERSGLAPDAERACEQVVRIPNLGRCDSLNVAVATGVVLFDLVRRAGEDPRPRDAVRLLPRALPRAVALSRASARESGG
jgi:TrmH family RNA methyltransferase